MNDVENKFTTEVDSCAELEEVMALLEAEARLVLIHIFN
jgi:hypothetical protein